MYCFSPVSPSDSHPVSTYQSRTSWKLSSVISSSFSVKLFESKISIKTLDLKWLFPQKEPRLFAISRKSARDSSLKWHCICQISFVFSIDSSDRLNWSSCVSRWRSTRSSWMFLQFLFAEIKFLESNKSPSFERIPIIDRKWQLNHPTALSVISNCQLREIRVCKWIDEFDRKLFLWTPFDHPDSQISKLSLVNLP